MRVRKKPVVVEAEQVYERTVVHTLEGDMVAEPGDYIITGVRGERYPIKADIFTETYEPAELSVDGREAAYRLMAKLYKDFEGEKLTPGRDDVYLMVTFQSALSAARGEAEVKLERRAAEIIRLNDLRQKEADELGARIKELEDAAWLLTTAVKALNNRFDKSPAMTVSNLAHYLPGISDASDTLAALTPEGVGR